jgi:hypothetical protein
LSWSTSNVFVCIKVSIQCPMPSPWLLLTVTTLEQRLSAEHFSKDTSNRPHVN